MGKKVHTIFCVSYFVYMQLVQKKRAFVIVNICVFVCDCVYLIYKFIHNSVGHYVHTYTKLRTCTINKHTIQGQSIIEYLNKYRSKLHNSPS